MLFQVKELSLVGSYTEMEYSDLTTIMTVIYNNLKTFDLGAFEFKYYVSEYCFFNEYGGYIKNIKSLDRYNETLYKAFKNLISDNPELSDNIFLNSLSVLSFYFSKTTSRMLYIKKDGG